MVVVQYPTKSTPFLHAQQLQFIICADSRHNKTTGAAGRMKHKQGGRGGF